MSYITSYGLSVVHNIVPDTYTISNGLLILTTALPTVTTDLTATLLPFTYIP